MPQIVYLRRRRYLRSQARGVTFVFAYDDTNPQLLHIWARHRKEPRHAMWTWFNGQHVWNQEHERYEGEVDDIGLYWFWLDVERAVVMVISCFRPYGPREER